MSESGETRQNRKKIEEGKRNGCWEFFIIKDEKGKRQEGNEAEKRKMHMWEEAE